MPFYEKGNVRIRYEEAGSGFPLFIIYGGGLNSKVTYANGPFDAMAEFKSEYRCIAMDLRNANGGESIGPLEIDRPWDSYADDQLGLMDHLGIDKFMVMGFCIGGPFIWNLLKRAGDRVVAAAVPEAAAPDRRRRVHGRRVAGAAWRRRGWSCRGRRGRRWRYCEVWWRTWRQARERGRHYTGPAGNGE